MPTANLPDSCPGRARPARCEIEVRHGSRGIGRMCCRDAQVSPLLSDSIRRFIPDQPFVPGQGASQWSDRHSPVGPWRVAFRLNKVALNHNLSETGVARHVRCCSPESSTRDHGPGSGRGCLRRRSRTRRAPRSGHCLRREHDLPQLSPGGRVNCARVDCKPIRRRMCAAGFVLVAAKADAKGADCLTMSHHWVV